MKASLIEEHSPIGAANLGTTDHKSWGQWKGSGKVSKVPGHPTHVQLVQPTYIRAEGRMPALQARGTDLLHWQWLRVRRLRRKRCRKTLWMMHVSGGMLQKTPTNDDTFVWQTQKVCIGCIMKLLFSPPNKILCMRCCSIFCHLCKHCWRFV